MLEIPNGINVDVKDNLITISGSLGKNKRVYNDKLMNVLIKDNQIHIECTKNKKLAKVANNTVNTLLKELKNDMDGVNKHFEIKMLAVFAHFPITLLRNKLRLGRRVHHVFLLCMPFLCLQQFVKHPPY